MLLCRRRAGEDSQEERLLNIEICATFRFFFNFRFSQNYVFEMSMNSMIDTHFSFLSAILPGNAEFIFFKNELRMLDDSFLIIN
jgi:hypothetical protein